MERQSVQIKEVLQQLDGRNTIVFSNGDMQPNVGVCFHGDLYDGGDVMYYNLFFEVVPDYNPIIKAEK